MAVSILLGLPRFILCIPVIVPPPLPRTPSCSVSDATQTSNSTRRSGRSPQTWANTNTCTTETTSTQSRWSGRWGTSSSRPSRTSSRRWRRWLKKSWSSRCPSETWGEGRELCLEPKLRKQAWMKIDLQARGLIVLLVSLCIDSRAPPTGVPACYNPRPVL